MASEVVFADEGKNLRARAEGEALDKAGEEVW